MIHISHRLRYSPCLEDRFVGALPPPTLEWVSTGEPYLSISGVSSGGRVTIGPWTRVGEERLDSSGTLRSWVPVFGPVPPSRVPDSPDPSTWTVVRDSLDLPCHGSSTVRLFPWVPTVTPSRTVLSETNRGTTTDTRTIEPSPSCPPWTGVPRPWKGERPRGPLLRRRPPPPPPPRPSERRVPLKHVRLKA